MSVFAYINRLKQGVEKMAPFNSRRSSYRRANSRRRSTTPRPTTRRRASNGGRPWSRTEIAFLRKNYRTQSTRWVARQLGRTAYSVRYKASDLSIKKANPSVWRANGSTTPTHRTGRPSRSRHASWTRRPSRTRRARSRR